MNKEDNETLKYFKKVYDELIEDEKYQKYSSLMNFYHKKIESLQHQLEEKDKIIDEILNDSWYTDECPIELDNFTKDDEREFDCEHCQNNYKKCWLKYFENQILERGKNENSNN